MTKMKENNIDKVKVAVNFADDPGYSEHLERLRKELVRWRDELGDTREQGNTFWGGF